MIVRRENSREIEPGTYDLRTEMVNTADFVLQSEQHLAGTNLHTAHASFTALLPGRTILAEVH